MYYRFDPNQGRSTYFVLSIYCWERFLASLRCQEYTYSYGGVDCLNSVPYSCYTPLVPLDSCLIASACLSSACWCIFIRWVTSQWFGVTSWVCGLLDFNMYWDRHLLTWVERCYVYWTGHFLILKGEWRKCHWKGMRVNRSGFHAVSFGGLGCRRGEDIALSSVLAYSLNSVDELVETILPRIKHSGH